LSILRPELRRPWEAYNRWLMQAFPYLWEAFIVLDADEESNYSRQIKFIDPRGS